MTIKEIKAEITRLEAKYGFPRIMPDGIRLRIRELFDALRRAS